jgi:hypothetical protein
MSDIPLAPIWQTAQSLLVVVMIFLLVRVHRQLSQLRRARSEAQKWLTEFVQVTNRTTHAFDVLSARFSELENGLRSAEARAKETRAPAADPGQTPPPTPPRDRVMNALAGVAEKRAALPDPAPDGAGRARSAFDNILSRLK